MLAVAPAVLLTASPDAGGRARSRPTLRIPCRPAMISGLQSGAIEATLGCKSFDEAIHRDELVIL